MNIPAIIRLIRPQQWIKNLFVFLPLFFDGRMTNAHLFFLACMAFVAFSLTASAIYCINDMRDVEADRLHPKKCKRPIASGQVSMAQARVITGLLLAEALLVGWFLFGPLRLYGLIVLGIYFVLNVAYCYKLKYVPIIDVFIVATGFVLRVCLGGVISALYLSPWIICMTFLLTLFIAVAKRRDDVVIYERDKVAVRYTSTLYNLPFLNQVLGILAAVSLVCYILYCVSPETEARLGSRYVYVTTVFMLAGLLHYLRLVLVENRSGDPSAILLSDKVLLGCIICWILSFVLILYV